MDANNQDRKEDEEESRLDYPPSYHPESANRKLKVLSNPSRSRADSLVVDKDTDANSDPSDRDSSGDSYRRRETQLMEDLQNGAGSKNYTRYRSQRRYGVPGLNDGQGSDPSTSDDVELEPLHSEDGSTDDEETGLTKEDRSHRKRRRRKTQRLDERVVSSIKPPSDQEQKAADRNFLRAMILNVLLIASWYFFSLSISIVSDLHPATYQNWWQSTTIEKNFVV